MCRFSNGKYTGQPVAPQPLARWPGPPNALLLHKRARPSPIFMSASESEWVKGEGGGVGDGGGARAGVVRVVARGGRGSTTTLGGGLAPTVAPHYRG
jgi:hypothetical protein